MIWYLEEMQAFHNHIHPDSTIDQHMSDLVEEWRFMLFLKGEDKTTRAKAKARGQTLNREIRQYNALLSIDDPA